MQRAGRFTLLLLLLVLPGCTRGVHDRREFVEDAVTPVSVAEPDETARDADLRSGDARQADVAMGSEPSRAAPGRPPEGDHEGTRALVKAMQDRLVAIGFAPGYPDGVFGARTRGALVEFQRVHRLPHTGEPDAATLEALFRAAMDDPDGEIQNTRGEDEFVPPQKPKLPRVRSFGFGAGVGFLSAAVIAAMGLATRRRK